jgi:hypothetical protein
MSTSVATGMKINQLLQQNFTTHPLLIKAITHILLNKPDINRVGEKILSRKKGRNNMPFIICLEL